ncbi:hypothetical protein DFH27DRAFT_501419, partial [Peziza echinospora]
MADPLSIGASILAIIGAVTKITKLVSDIVDVPQSIERVVSDVRSFRMVILALRRFLIHRIQHPAEMVELEEHVYVDDLVYILQEGMKITAALEMLVQGICSAVRNGDSFEVTINALGRAKWAMQEKEILAHVRSLESHKMSLNTVVTLLNCHEMSEARRQTAHDLHTSTRHLAMGHHQLASEHQYPLSIAAGNGSVAGVAQPSGAGGNNLSTPAERRNRQTLQLSNAGIGHLGATLQNGRFLDEQASIGNFFRILMQSRAYSKAERAAWSDGMTMSELHQSSHGVFMYRPGTGWGASPNSWGADFGRARDLQQMLARYPRALKSPRKQGEALIDAAKNGHRAALRALLAYDVNPNCTDDSGRSALHWAAEMRDGKACGALLAAGADVDAKDDDNET